MLVGVLVKYEFHHVLSQNAAREFVWVIFAGVLVNPYPQKDVSMPPTNFAH